MPKLIDIDAFLPEDVDLRWRGQVWKIPGDLVVERVLRIQAAFSRLDSATGAKDEAGVREAFQQLAETVAEVLAIRQPERAQGLEFGARELGILAGAILMALNSTGEEKQSETTGDQGNVETAAGT